MSRNISIFVLALLIVAIIGLAVYSLGFNGYLNDKGTTFYLNGDEEEEEEEEEDEFEGEAEELGSLAFYGGVLLSGGYVAVKHARRYVKFDPKLLRLSLDIHSIGNILLAPAALIHGYVNLEYAGPIEYAMAIIIVVLVLSGATMRYLRSRRAKIVARMIHSQRTLAILLLILALLHIARMD